MLERRETATQIYDRLIDKPKVTNDSDFLTQYTKIYMEYNHIGLEKTDVVPMVKMVQYWNRTHHPKFH